jgi:hypothetical protein
MFSVQQKREIAEKVQQILRDTQHPELPKGEISFFLHVDGTEAWSWADIRNNGAVAEPEVNPWNEEPRLRPQSAERFGIYIVSKIRHAQRWKDLRASGVPIISTWIDEAGEGETESYPDLWVRCIREASTAERCIVYAEDGEQLKGALVEVGAALAGGTPVIMVGEIEPMKTAANHPLVSRADSIEKALEAYARAPWNESTKKETGQAEAHPVDTGSPPQKT